jgi:hypothetical protein
MLIGPRIVGFCLVVAAILFWLSWALMPGVGITDARQILDLVSQQRPSVRLSAILQLVSAAAYVPALLGIATIGAATKHRAIGVGALLLLLGTLGSVADAMLHLLAYEMTAPGADRAAMIPVMDRMQGPDLLLIAPLIAAFFVGSVVIAIGFSRAHRVSSGHLFLYAIAVLAVIVAGVTRGSGNVGPRVTGLVVLGTVSLSQTWLGLALVRQTVRSEYASAGKSGRR